MPKHTCVFPLFFVVDNPRDALNAVYAVVVGLGRPSPSANVFMAVNAVAMLCKHLYS